MSVVYIIDIMNGERFNLLIEKCTNYFLIMEYR